MSEQIQEMFETFRTYDDIYIQLLIEGVETCQYLLDSDCIWKRLELQWMSDYFLQKEEYEKCAVLKEYINNFFIAPNVKQFELNNKLQFIK
jgi:hypothetical protein